MQAIKTWSDDVLNWLEDRTAFQEALEALLHVIIPRRVETYFLGGLALFFFIVQSITGVLLVFYYRPTPETAYESILFIMNEVPFGWLIRSIHSWAANLMIVASILHLLRVYIQGVYKAPRELTWVAGVILGLLTLAFGFTGYLLPWDQLSFWATTVGTEIAGSVPLIGIYIMRFLRGGSEITALTLSRFYAIHTLVLPVALGAMLFVHLYLVHYHGLAELPTLEED